MSGEGASLGHPFEGTPRKVDSFADVGKAGQFRVAYRLRGVDHMDVTMDYPDRAEALQWVSRISAYPDLIYLQFKEL